MRISCWLFCIISALIVNNISFAGSFVHRCADLSILKKNILEKIIEIESYQLDTKVEIDGNVVSAKILGQIPNWLRVEQKLQYGSEQLLTKVVFDGKSQWVESKTSNQVQVLKINLPDLVTEERPFDTGYYSMGTGLIHGEDFPSTIKILLSLYDFSADCQPAKIVLEGYLNLKKFEEYVLKRKFQKSNVQFKEKFKKDFDFAKITFGYPNYLIQSYSLGESSANETITVTFTNIRINLINIENEFEYKVPKGIDPVDITDDIKKYCLTIDKQSVEKHQ